MKQCFTPGPPLGPCQPERNFAVKDHRNTSGNKVSFTNSDDMITVSQRLF